MTDSAPFDGRLALIEAFERRLRSEPDAPFALFVDACGEATSGSCASMRAAAARFSDELRALGARPGDAVVADMPNGPRFATAVLSALYDGFVIVALNGRLSQEEKNRRLHEARGAGMRLVAVVDETSVSRFSSRETGRANARGRRAAVAAPAVCGDAVVMFTSGTSGTPKAVVLTWDNLAFSARSSNEALASARRGAWQAVLPFFHVGGLQVLIRSMLAGAAPVVYERFDAARVLADAVRYGATHVSVVDKMLRDMLDAAEGDDPVLARGLAGYECVLLGGAALNPATVRRVRAADVRVYASYGMTETSSQIANALIDEGFSGALKVLPGYEARIVEPDGDGFGMLAVRGGGVFGGYANAEASYDAAGFFITGDTAAVRNGMLTVRERTADMFVSGGENVYPAEVACAIKGVDGVGDAHVFGVPDVVWGRRPAAVVERVDAALDEAALRRHLAGVLSRLTMPDALLVVDEMPRSGIGKIDRARCEGLFARRIDVRTVRVFRLRLPFRTPFSTAQGVLRERDAAVVEIEDHVGRIGLGECSSFSTAWYLPETLGDDLDLIERVLAPALRSRSFAHPREVAGFLETLPGASAHPMACAALESACWDLYGRIVHRPLWSLMRDEYRRVRAASGRTSAQAPCAATFDGPTALVSAGAVVGRGSRDEVLAAVRAACKAGYRRVKLKVAPDDDVHALRSLVGACSDIAISFDANGGFGAADSEGLAELDAAGACWIEEPGASAAADSAVSSEDRLDALASLQRTLRTPICVDESFFTRDEAMGVLRRGSLRCVAVKPPKFGGIGPAIEFVARAHESGVLAWAGGMYDTGIARRVVAAFGALPGMETPGDIGAVDRYFACDVARPPYRVVDGRAVLNEEGFEDGIGCELDRDALNDLLAERIVIGEGVAPS